MLLITNQGVFGSALERVLTAAGGGAVPTVDTSADLFSSAMGQGTLVYVPSASLLDGFLDPRPDAQRMRRVLGAAKAPGVEQLVVVVPVGDGYRAEIEVLRRDGKPFVIVECPPLLEEVAALPRAAAKRARALLRESGVRCARAAGAAEHVAAAVRGRQHGAVLAVPVRRSSARERLLDAARVVWNAGSGAVAQARAMLAGVGCFSWSRLSWLALLLLLPIALAWGLFLLVVALPALAVFAVAVAFAGREEVRAPVRDDESQPRKLEPRKAVATESFEPRQAA